MIDPIIYILPTSFVQEKRTVQENMEEGIVGGLGISIVKSISKETEYCYSNNKNILIIKF